MCSISWPFAFSSLFIFRFRSSIGGLMLSGGGGILPSPTRLRKVSGMRLVSALGIVMIRVNEQDQKHQYDTR